MLNFEEKEKGAESEEEAEESDLEDSAEESDESDDPSEALAHTGILPMKEKKVFLSLQDGTQVRLVDGSCAYPFATAFTDYDVFFLIRKSVDSEREVKVSPLSTHLSSDLFLFSFRLCVSRKSSI